MLEEKDTKINDLQFQLEQFKRLLFRSKRERFIAEINSDQMLLPFVDQVKVTEEVTQKVEYIRKKNKRENHHGRLPLPSHLPVEEIIIEPKENTEDLKCIGKKR